MTSAYSQAYNGRQEDKGLTIKSTQKAKTNLELPQGSPTLSSTFGSSNL